MSTKEIVTTKQAPPVIGPYSQAIRHDGLLFVSGQLPVDPTTGQLVAQGIEVQTRRVMENLKAVASAGGASLQSLLKVTIYLADLADFAALNQVYGEYLPDGPPARCCVQVAKLPLGARVEIDAIAAADSVR